MKDTTTATIEATHALAKEFMHALRDDQKVITLMGDLGSGKTTFTQGFLAACGAQGPYTSPTFTIMKEYDVDVHTIKKIYHIDAYRITSQDMIELGWQDLLADPSARIIVEWPEKIQDILPDDSVAITCTWVSESERCYIFNH